MTGTAETDAAAPAETRALLLTFLIADVRGYTRFTGERGDEAAAQLADRFAGLCEELIGQHDGKLIELRGDEALAVFSSARSALRGAVALQQAFRQAVIDDPSLPLMVGMGLDAGEPIPLRGGYRGGALNLAARLCSIAGTGEILASEGVIHLARKTEGLDFIDRGEVSLKGLASPVRVLQIAPEGELPKDLPPLQPILVTHPTNLPDDPTPFIGREAEITAITALLQRPGVRLVTLTGPGGTGKTRLGLQVGNSLLYSFRDGVFFCDLAPLTDPALVPSAIAGVLGVKEEGSKELREVLIEHLGNKDLLLVLDNFEHLLDASATVSSLLDACRELHILITSRIPLHLSREQEHAVPPLSVPDPRVVQDVASLSQYESVALFIQRAKAARDSFAVTDENAPAVAEVCARLDGLPLAIELAAARIKLFPPQALLQRLDSRLKLLTGGARDRPSRQQTLRGAIDWSYSLLSDKEQVLFARLSVFAGGSTFEAAEAVCDPEGDLDLLEGLASLVDKSLVKQAGEEEPRFTMLETLREYATEKLDERGERPAIAEAHARYYLELAMNAQIEARSAWFSRIDAELDNVRVALRWALEHDPEQALRAAIAVSRYWEGRGGFSEGEAWLQEAFERGESVSLEQRALALTWLAGYRRMFGDMESAASLAEEGLLLARQSGKSGAIANALTETAQQAVFRRDTDTARRAVEEGVPLARSSGESASLSELLQTGGSIAVCEGKVEKARDLLEEAWAIQRKDGDFGSVPWMLAGLALLRGDPADAQAKAEEHIALSESMGGIWFVRSHTVEMLARAYILQEDLSAARALLHSVVAALTESGVKLCRAHALEGFARLALAQDQPERAVRMLAGSFAIQEALGMTVLPIERLLLDQTVEAARATVDVATFARAWEEGMATSAEEAIAFALGEA
jgi:predicted ATPase/class 3 adenylate cyclase